jgi:ketosteroid isomerase-like protein
MPAMSMSSRSADDRDPASLAAVERFGVAFDAQDLDAVLAAMTDDCAFESTAPPDGVRAEGPAAVRAAFGEFFAASAGAAFETEEQIVAGDRVVVRWRYTWPATESGPSGHVRGIDVFRIRDGLVAEKASYVKG